MTGTSGPDVIHGLGGNDHQLKEQAKQQGRSLQAEVKRILEQEAHEAAARWSEHLAGRVLSDSTDLVREDRDR